MTQRKEYMKQWRAENPEYMKRWRLKNIEHINKREKEYRLKNKKQKAKYDKEYRVNNRERLNAYRRKKERNDLSFKLSCKLRCRMYQALKGISKSASTMELIGCTIEELRRHLESKFEPWMTWANYGLWDIDHIKACATFNLTYPEQQRECFHWSNLQPLEAVVNIKKGNR